MEKLTKEDFWNSLKDSCPSEMEKFCQWIDDYKKRVDWKKLFNYGSPHYSAMGHHNPKYHDLPVAMQKGILLDYILTSNPGNKHSGIVTKVALASDFLEIQEGIKAYFESKS
jgi:aromatic ring-opening dioxygenase catalytic subunit (LigB family)